MPDNPTVWIVLIAVVAVVVALMVWKGRGGSYSDGKRTFTLQGKPQPGADVKVAENLKLEQAKVGNITGVKGSPGATPPGRVDVANNASITGGSVEDITGVDLSGGGSSASKK
jgi:hypothetical protein